MFEKENKLNQGFFEAQRNAHFVRTYQHGYKVEFNMNKDTLDIVRSMYAPMEIIPGTGPPTQHPIAAVHQRVAEQQAAKITKGETCFIEIGPSARGFVRSAIGNPRVHGCTMTSARDQQRHLKSASSKFLRGFRADKEALRRAEVNGLTPEVYLERVNALAIGQPTNTFCVNGWQNCDHQAPIAVANHSLYDIELGELALGMENHGCHIIDAWMHFPIQALEVDSWTDFNNGYQFTTRQDEEGEQVIDFSFIGDYSFGYSHRKNTWLSYLRVGAIDTPHGFSMVIEKVNRWGSHFHIRITRATSAGTIFYRIPNALVGLCKVPSFTALAVNKFCKRQDVRYIVTDLHKVRKLFRFIMARDSKGFCHETVLAYARTMCSEVRFGDTVIEEHWNISIDDFQELCLAIYILAVFHRQRASHVVAGALNHLSKIDEEPGFFEKCWKEVKSWLKQAGWDLDANHQHETDRKLDGKSSNLFNRAAIVFFDDIDIHNKVREYDSALSVNFDILPEAPKETLQDKVEINRIRNAQAAKDIKGEPCVWAGQFSLQAEMPEALQQDYLGEDQHRTLIRETEARVAELENEPERKPLLVAFQCALNLFRKRDPDHLYVENMVLLQGVFGSGKTGKVIGEVIPNILATKSDARVLVLCPTAALRDQYAPQVQTPSRVATIHTGAGILARNSFDVVIIEEAFTLPMAYINAIAMSQKTILVGDPHQIESVDFSGMWAGCSLLSRYAKYIPRQMLMETRRSPQDIVALPLIQTSYPGIKSLSPKATSIQFVGPTAKPNPESKTITLVQAVKEELSTTEGVAANTAHEEQGRTYPSVFFVYNGTSGERRLLRESKNHLIVAVTRHTNTLYIRDATAGDGQTGEVLNALNDRAPLSHYADNANVEIQALEVVETPKLAEPTHVLPLANPMPYPEASTSSVVANQIINEYYPARPMEEHYSNLHTSLPKGEDARGTLRLDNLGQDEARQVKKHTVRRFPYPQRVMTTRNKDQRMLLKSKLSRLGKKTQNLSADAAQALSDRFFSNLDPEFDWTITKEMRDSAFAAACEKFQDRGHDMQDLMDITHWTERGANLVKSFLKAQQKPALDKDVLTRDKAGQNISAWSKTLNFQICVYTRLLEQVLVTQTKGRIKIMTGMTDQEIMAMLESDGKADDRFLENDWSEFDSSQNNTNRLVHMRAMERIGCPKELLELFRTQLESRTICCDALTMHVNDKKDSGAPHTFIDNCLVNLSVLLDVVEKFDKLYIKGDDSLARGKDVSFNLHKIKEYSHSSGYKFKPKAGHSGNFVSFIVNKSGCAFDLPRIAGKVLSRDYTNREDWDEYRKAIGVTLRYITVDSGRNMCLVNSMHYIGNHDAEGQFDILLSFLLKFAHGDIKFSETVQREVINYITDGKRNLSDEHRPRPFQEKPITRYRGNLVDIRPRRRLANACVAALGTIMS
jgi:hypothetical protein